MQYARLCGTLANYSLKMTGVKRRWGLLQGKFIHETTLSLRSRDIKSAADFRWQCKFLRIPQFVDRRRKTVIRTTNRGWAYLAACWSQNEQDLFSDLFTPNYRDIRVAITGFHGLARAFNCKHNEHLDKIGKRTDSNWRLYAVLSFIRRLSHIVNIVH